MAEQIVGMTQLQARLRAISAAKGGPELMKLAANVARGQMVLNMPRKTGGTGRSLHVTGVTSSSAQIRGSQVAAWIEEGTGLYGPAHHVITPVAARVLAWRVGSVRLSGASRVSKGRQLAGWAFARSVKGMKPRPFMARSIVEAGRQVGGQLVGEIVNLWNGAA